MPCHQPVMLSCRNLTETEDVAEPEGESRELEAALEPEAAAKPGVAVIPGVAMGHGMGCCPRVHVSLCEGCLWPFDPFTRVREAWAAGQGCQDAPKK